MAYLIAELDQKETAGPELRGAVRQLWASHSPEIMVAGPAETGKTFGCLLKVNALAWKYPSCRGVICRRTYQSMSASVICSFEEKILHDTLGPIVKSYGGSRPEFYDYPNGSRVWVVGLDKAGKVLSSEMDFIYVNQAEEIELADWETLLTRTTGRAGHMPYAQLFGDCNPGPSTHWIKTREAPGYVFLESRHQDNPVLYSGAGEITSQGARTMAALNSLTGTRLQRLRYGNWVSSEGQVYENFDPSKNVCFVRDIPPCRRFLEVVDFGYTNPFCWQRWAIDQDDRMFLEMEVYHTQRIVEHHCQTINHVTHGRPKPELTLADHDAEDRATYEKYRGVRTRKADKSVIAGIQEMQARIRDSRIFFTKDSLVEVDLSLKANFKPTCSLEEIEGYVWNDTKDIPIKVNDHGMDNSRYVCRYLDRRKYQKRALGSYMFG